MIKVKPSSLDHSAICWLLFPCATSRSTSVSRLLSGDSHQEPAAGLLPHIEVERVEAEHLNLGGSPMWVVLLFVINGGPLVILDRLLHLAVVSGLFAAFAVYFIVVEEVHWRLHLGEWLPAICDPARAYHLAHHERPNSRYNIFLPLWDVLLGSTKD